MGFLNSEGLSHLVQGIKALLAKKVDKVDGKGLSTNDYTTEEKQKLAGLQNYTHPDTPGYKHIPAGGAVGQILRWQADGTATWGSETDTAYSVVTQEHDGLMSHTDKIKLDGIEEGANNYVHPAHTEYVSGLYKITVDDEGHVTSATQVVKLDITSLGIPGQDTTYEDATQDGSGLMSGADKKKLDGIQEGANKYTHPSYTAQSSGLYKVTVDGTGHVSAVEAVSKGDITGLGIPGQDTTYAPATGSTNGLMAATDKTKLDAVPEPTTIATQTYVASQIASAGHITKQIVEALPDVESAQENVIYMILSDDPKEDDNVYDEYMLINGALEHIGSTKTVIEAIPNSEIDNLLKD